MTTRRVVLIAVGVIWGAACSLNPQPIPPGFEGASALSDGGTAPYPPPTTGPGTGVPVADSGMPLPQDGNDAGDDASGSLHDDGGTEDGEAGIDGGADAADADAAVTDAPPE